VPQQEHLAVAGRQLLQCDADVGTLVLRVQRVVRRGLDGLWLGLEQCEVAALPRRAPGVVSRHVRRHDEQPSPRVVGFVYDGPSEGLLGQVLGALDAPHLAVQEAHERAVGGAVDLGEVLAHPRKSRTSRSSSPSSQVVLPPVSILTLTWCPATSTAGSSVAGCSSSGRARSSAKYASLKAATLTTRTESPCAMSVHTASRHANTRPPTCCERLTLPRSGTTMESAAAAPAATTASRLNELAILRAASERRTASAPAWSCGAGAISGMGRTATLGSCTRYDVYSVRMPYRNASRFSSSTISGLGPCS